MKYKKIITLIILGVIMCNFIIRTNTKEKINTAKVYQESNKKTEYNNKSFDIIWLTNNAETNFSDKPIDTSWKQNRELNKDKLKNDTLLSERSIENIYLWGEHLIFGVTFGVCKASINDAVDIYEDKRKK